MGKSKSSNKKSNKTKTIKKTNEVRVVEEPKIEEHHETTNSSNKFIIGLIVVIAVIILALLIFKKPNNVTPIIYPNDSNTVEAKEKEYNDLAKELDKIEDSLNEKRDIIDKLNEDLATFVKKHPNLMETELRSSSEYIELSNQINELNEEIRNLENSKLPYYERQVKLQEEIRELKIKQESQEIEEIDE